MHTTYKQPPFLQAGDTIGIVSPARKISEEEINPAIKLIESWGYKVKLADNIFAEDRQFAGTDDERAADFQNMMDDENIKAILCARGGYGSVRLIPKLDFTKFNVNPKWIIGYSDITVFHSYLNMVSGICSIHGTMPLNFPKEGIDNESTKALHEVLGGELNHVRFPHQKRNRMAAGTGILVGGNLSMLYSLRGTFMDLDTDGKILFIEDLDEYLYHIDRIMMNLKLGGKLEKLSGLIVGGMSDMNDNTIPYGRTAVEIIKEAVAGYNFPIAFGFPAGHQDVNLPLMFGKYVSLQVNFEFSILKYI